MRSVKILAPIPFVAVALLVACGDANVTALNELESGVAIPTGTVALLVGPPDDHTACQDDVAHKPGLEEPYTSSCTTCHGSNLTGDYGPSCYTCHEKEWEESNPNPPVGHTVDKDGVFHASGLKDPYTASCTTCHGSSLRGDIGPSCYTCHEKEWEEENPNPPTGHTVEKDGVFHASGLKDPYTSSCTTCHGPSLRGDVGPSCYTCHEKEWDEQNPNPPAGHTVEQDGVFHAPGLDSPFTNCAACHGPSLMGDAGPSCYSCHDRKWEESVGACRDDDADDEHDDEHDDEDDDEDDDEEEHR